MLILTKEDVQKAVAMPEAINIVEKAYAEYYQERAITPLRTRIHCEPVSGDILFMPAYMGTLGGLGLKIVSVFPQNIKLNKPTLSAILILNDVQTGEPLAMMDATYLTALRTGAASGVATRHLAKKQVQKAAVFGAGAQALRQLEAILEERSFAEINVFDVDPGRVQNFIALCKQELERFSLNIKAADTSKAAVTDADVIVTATTANKPVFSGDDIKPGVHINGIGSYTPEMQEIDETCVTRANKIVIDSFEASFKEAGDLIIPLEKGLITKEDIYCEIGKITCGEVPGRESDDEITFFKSVGIAVQDIAVARLVYDNALAKGLGQQIQL